MSTLQGVYTAYKKNGTKYFRSSITYKNKHVSLGSYDSEADAHKAYLEAADLLSDNTLTILAYSLTKNTLSFEKWIILVNFRDNHIYIKNPIYLHKKYFSYYLNINLELKFDIDDLFYYSSHKIMKRQGHLFVADYGMQVNILSRYGIKNYGVVGKDYLFSNNDPTDYRYENIIIINKYHGVEQIRKKNNTVYQAKIHINGNFIAGYYNDEITAAIAYNKAVDILKKAGLEKNYQTNYCSEISSKEYADIYQQIKISKKILNWRLEEPTV
ncbi:hypothetical protein [Konateibacter massiliensis]|uniref:hypothetical protein n=1 Tax=Konateibacter massiliensis TaxID=2002841 RepID=UPI000C1523B5|nr:hypothetical protein [Konateibacter massiliensis]